MKRRMFALGDILLGTILHIAVFILGFWSEIRNGNEVEIFIWLFVSLVVFAMIFDNIIIIKNDVISLKYFNPFVKNKSISFNEIEKVIIRADGIKSTLVIITICKKDGTKSKLLNLSASYLDELYDFLVKNHLSVERTGTA